MAKIFKNDHHLEKEYIEEKSHRSASFFVCIIMLAATVFFGAVYAVSGFTLFGSLCALSTIIGIIALAVGVTKDDSKAEILKSGIEGETETAFLLSHLPQGYTVVQDVHITYDGKTSEIDNIAIGKSGIFVIETKNQKGYIEADVDEKDWIQHKVGRGGTPYSKEFYSPIKQVGTHIFRLSRYLKSNGVRTYINGVVYFANPEAAVEIYGDCSKCPVFTYKSRHEMLGYILSGGANLTKEQIRKIESLIRASK